MIRNGLFLAIAFTAVVCAQVDRPQLPPLGPGVRLLGAQAGRPGQVVKGAPFSADVTTEVMQTLSDGNKIRRVTSERVYRDSEGRTRREASLSVLGSTNTAAGAAQVAFIEDPVAGSSYALDLPNRTVTTRPWRQPPPGNGPRADQLPGQQRLANDPNAKTESLGRQTIAGVPADGTRVTVTIPAGQIGNSLAIQIVSERWYSPELQMVVLQKRSDPRSGETVYQMSNVIRAEPPSTLFVPPADFQTLSDRGPRGRFRPGPPQ